MLILAGRAAAAPQAVAPAQPGASGYAVFLRGTPIGREAVTIARTAETTTITTQGRLTPPLDVTVRSARFVYGPDWSPLSLAIDATTAAGALRVTTKYDAATAATEGLMGTTPVAVSHPVSPQSLIFVNGIFGSFAALAMRLEGAEPGTELRVYVVPQAEIGARVTAVRDERMQVGTSFLDVRRYELAMANPGGDLSISLTTDRASRLVRVSIPSQSLDVIREDVASSTSRTQIHSNPGDEPVVVPAAGFNLGATITRPAGAAGGAPLPAAILLSGSGVHDRDGVVAGIPLAAQLAGALADAGLLVVRYDTRGNGQSGGRAESATISDVTEDARAVFKWLEKRPDVDRRRIAVIGHAEGAWVAMLAATRERRIAAVVSLAGPSSTGAELVLEQQQAALDRMGLAPEERETRIALQKQVQSAVMTGKGWETVPAELRREADTPWFQSLLLFDPSKVIDDLRQPLLLVHGELDRQVPIAHAERLADLARTTSKSKSVELVIVKGVNHLLVPAETGETSEYPTLVDRTLSPDVTKAAGDWLTRTLAAVR